MTLKSSAKQRTGGRRGQSPLAVFEARGTVSFASLLAVFHRSDFLKLVYNKK